MMDVMRQQPAKKKMDKKTDASKAKDRNKEENNEIESSFSQKKKASDDEDEAACYCCGDSDHMLPKCPKKDSLPKNEWYKPQYCNESKREGKRVNCQKAFYPTANYGTNTS